MIKLYCDRCGKECSELFDVSVPIEKTGKLDFRAKPIKVCPDCANLANRLFDISIDVKLSLFNNFFEIKEDNR